MSSEGEQHTEPSLFRVILETCPGVLIGDPYRIFLPQAEMYLEEVKDAETGRPTGYLFLEKLFQLSVRVPSVHPELRNQFLEHLLEGEAGTDSERAVQEENQFQKAVEQASKKLAPIKHEAELYAQLSETSDDPVKAQARIGLEPIDILFPAMPGT